MAVLSLVIIIKELLSEPTHKLCYYFYNYSSISQSASECDKLKTEYIKALTFVTRHNRPFRTKRLLILHIGVNKLLNKNFSF